MYADAPLLDSIGRIMIVSLFVVAGIVNASPAGVKDHVDRMAGFGLPFPKLLFWFGTLLEFSGCVMVLTGWHGDIGAMFLIVFTVTATAIFHRFWIHTDPMRRKISKLTILSNIAIVGGLLLLLQNLR